MYLWENKSVILFKDKIQYHTICNLSDDKFDSFCSMY